MRRIDAVKVRSAQDTPQAVNITVKISVNAEHIDPAVLLDRIAPD